MHVSFYLGLRFILKTRPRLFFMSDVAKAQHSESEYLARNREPKHNIYKLNNYVKINCI